MQGRFFFQRCELAPASLHRPTRIPPPLPNFEDSSRPTNRLGIPCRACQCDEDPSSGRHLITIINEAIERGVARSHAMPSSICLELGGSAWLSLLSRREMHFANRGTLHAPNALDEPKEETERHMSRIIAGLLATCYLARDSPPSASHAHAGILARLPTIVSQPTKSRLHERLTTTLQPTTPLSAPKQQSSRAYRIHTRSWSIAGGRALDFSGGSSTNKLGVTGYYGEASLTQLGMIQGPPSVQLDLVHLSKGRPGTTSASRRRLASVHVQVVGGVSHLTPTSAADSMWAVPPSGLL